MLSLTGKRAYNSAEARRANIILQLDNILASNNGTFVPWNEERRKLFPLSCRSDHEGEQGEKTTEVHCKK